MYAIHVEKTSAVATTSYESASYGHGIAHAKGEAKKLTKRGQR
jgi:hypothetical protein